MEKAREIKKKIDNINEIRKITKTMEIVSSFKISRAQRRILEARPFFEEVEDFIIDMASYSSGIDDPLVKPREKEDGVLVIGVTSDKGLCGAYNANVIRSIENMIEEIESEGKEVKLDIVGIRGIDYFSYRGFELSKTYKYLSEYPKFLDAREIAKDIIARYVSGEVDKVIICYTRFINIVEHRTVSQQILPIPFDLRAKKQGLEQGLNGDKEARISNSVNTVVNTSSAHKITLEFTYDPSVQEILSSLLPEYIYSIVYIALLESTASEIGARMTAMRNATDNADEIVEELKRRYNRARQQEITLELAEIASEAEFLKKV